MKLFRILARNIRDSFRSVFRNFSLSLSSIACITITLIVVSASMLISYNVNNFTHLVEKDVTIVVFLEDDITKDEIEEINDKINLLNYVESYEYVDKQETAESMMKSSETFKSIMGEWDEETNPLLNSFKVKVTDINFIDEVAKEIQGFENVKVVKYGEGKIEQLIKTFDIAEKISIAIVIALVIVTAFLISNTIKITIFSRKREIEIMRLVGASNLNIKIPFIFEGLILGVFGSIIPILITTYGYVALYQFFNGKFMTPFIQLIKPNPFIYYVSAILVIIGITVGMIGSWRAVRKHLKI